jgi:hypothetical protein
MFFTFLPLISSAQYPFEQYPGIQYKNYNVWKVHETKQKIENTLTIPSFFDNGDTLTIKLISFPEHWFENSEIKIFKNSKQIKKYNENIGFNPIALDTVRTADINGDKLKDIKIIAPYMGNGMASLNAKVIYLFQEIDETFTKVSFDDKQSENRIERDFNGDGNFEIITMQLMNYNNHSYWNFNLFNFINDDITNVNSKYNYPILIQFLHKETFEITEKITRQKMKDFTLKVPEEYDKQ